ncbi:histidinol dehydrogenase [Endozoicomonas sp.]|nr:histidinol dehydrogenase [Endozoicomonas sp.]
MQKIVWQEIGEQQQQALLKRPAILAGKSITAAVSEIIAGVHQGGDRSLMAYTKEFDCYQPEQLRVTQQQIKEAASRLSGELKEAIQHAYKNIRSFHCAQALPPVRVETDIGVTCEQVTRPIESAGLYIPGGSAPLPSTVLMLGVPAQLAGCEKVVLCSPPPIADAILYAASLCDITNIINVGGAQSVAAMAYGTETVEKVDKIYGPGNAFVTEAKRQVSADEGGAAIDMPAGPSEVMVIADEKADPDFIAADLLSQAEHGPDSQVVLVTTEAMIADRTTVAIEQQLEKLTRASITRQALDNSLLIVVDSLEECLEIANSYGPEHLIIQTQNPRELVSGIKRAGSVFLGAWSPESVGDYASGTNHVLPTYGYARTCSSLGLADFTRRMTVQELSKDGLKTIAPTVMAMADAEGLDAHRQAVAVRLKKLREGTI